MKRRIVIIQDYAQWTGSVENQEFLSIPKDVDITREQGEWFAAGGGTFENFIAHLLRKGAKKLDVETYPMHYQ